MEDFPHNDNSVCESKNTRLHRADSWGKALVGSDRREAGVGVARQPERVFYIQAALGIGGIRQELHIQYTNAGNASENCCASLRLGIGGTALKDNIDDAKLLES